MKNRNEETQRSLNVLLGLLAGAEEAANEELNDGSNGEPTVTKDDRQQSRAVVEWIRYTLLGQDKVQPSKRLTLRPQHGERLLDDDSLFAALDSDDPNCRRDAVNALDALAALAAVRAKIRQSSFLVERQAVFDSDLMQRDLASLDRELADTAMRAFVSVTLVGSYLHAKDVELTEDDLAAVERMHQHGRALFEETREK